MSELKIKLKLALSYLQDNAKAALAILNAIVIVALLYIVVSHALFELRIRGLVKTALALETKVVQADGAGGSNAPAPAADPRHSDRGRDRTPEGRGASPDSAAHAVDAGSTPVETRASTSPDAGSGSGTLLADHPTSGSEPTSASVASNPDPGTSGTTDSVATSGTMASSGTLVLASDEPPSTAEVSTRTVAVARRAAGWMAHAWTGVKKTLGSGEGEQGAGPPKPPDRPDGRSNPRKPDDPKLAQFKKMQERALFGGEKPTVHNPVLMGVLGDRALIDNNWVRVGEKAGAYEIVSITATSAFLRDSEGNERTLSLGPEGGGESPRGGPPRPGGPPPPPGAPGSPEVSFGTDGSRPPSGGFDPSRIPTAVLERLTRPGGPFEGMTADQIRGMDPDAIRERLQSRRDGMRGGRGGSRGGFGRD